MKVNRLSSYEQPSKSALEPWRRWGQYQGGQVHLMLQAWRSKDPSRDACLPSLDPNRVFNGQSLFLCQVGFFFFNLFYSYSQGKRNKTLNLCFLNFTVLKVQTITMHMKHDISLGVSKCHTLTPSVESVVSLKVQPLTLQGFLWWPRQ